MNNRAKYLAVTAVVAALVLGVFAMKSPEYLQGSFPGSGATWAVDASSPSGSRTVSASDSIFAFDVTAGAREINFPDGTRFDVTFASSTGDIDVFTPAGAQVTLVNTAGNPVAYGYIATNDQGENPTAAWASLYFRNSNWSSTDTDISAGVTETYTLKLDSAGLLAEDSGEDDQLVVSMRYGNITLTGNTLRY